MCSCSLDCQLIVWSLDSPSPLRTLTGHAAWVHSVDWDPRGEVSPFLLSEVVHRVGEQRQRAARLVDLVLDLRPFRRPVFVLLVIFVVIFVVIFAVTFAALGRLRLRALQAGALGARRVPPLPHPRRLRRFHVSTAP